MQELKFKILEYVRLRGPVIPVQISKQIGSNILFAGAVLSELLANGKIKISTAKIGGSPLYYFPGQEPRLTMLYSYLHQREKQAYDLLKEKQVLRDKELEPVQRVALREIKDFAYPIQINDEIFWRWYLINEDDAFNLIKQNYEEKKVEEPKIEIKEEPKIEIQEIKEKIKVEEKQQVKEEPKIEIKEPKADLPEKKTKVKEMQEYLKEEVKKKKEIKIKGDFILLLRNYFENNNIKIIDETIIKKGREFDYIAEIPSQIGNIRVFLSAKDKKRLSDSDLSLAHNKSQLKKLPLFILSNGDLTKQAKDYMNSNYLIFEKI